MKAFSLLVLAGLLTPALVARPAQEPRKKPQEPTEKPDETPRKRTNPVTAFFEGESARLSTEIEGSWMLFGYSDPESAQTQDQASGFATFHDGFMTWIMTLDTYEQRFLSIQDVLLISSGAYRYRFDEQAFLQLSCVMSFTNETDDGEVQREPSGLVREYYATLADGVLELRNPDGITFSFRKVTAGDFPDSAIRKLESQRSGTPQHEVEVIGR